MSFLKFYVILTVLGILIDVWGIFLSINQGTLEQLVICLITSILFLFVGVRGLVRKIKEYA